jgi:hypothetical protein
MSAALQFEVREGPQKLSPEYAAQLEAYCTAFARAYPPGAVIDFTRGCDAGAGDEAVAITRENKGAF